MKFILSFAVSFLIHESSIAQDRASDVVWCAAPYYSEDPWFPGGQDSLSKYLNRSINSKSEWFLNDSVIRVRAQFRIGTSGAISNLRFRNPELITDECRKEIENAFLNMPKWIVPKDYIDDKYQWFSIPLTLYKPKESK